MISCSQGIGDAYGRGFGPSEILVRYGNWACAGSALSRASRSTATSRDVEIDPHRRVIARLFPATGVAIDTRRLQGFRERRAEQRMVDADAGVSLERVSPVMPECVDSLVAVEMAQRVGPALRDDLRKFLPRLR